MKKFANTATLGLVALASLWLVAVATPLVASMGVAALSIVAAVTWMAAVHGLLPDRDAGRRVPVRAGAPSRAASRRRR